MKDFFYLEGAYLLLGVFIILITLFVTSRPFMPQGALKKGLFWVFGVITVMIGTHYTMTTNRIGRVKVAFYDNKVIICENRIMRKVAQTVLIQKSNEWLLKEDYFVSPHYNRAFFAARCIVKQ